MEHSVPLSTKLLLIFSLLSVFLEISTAVDCKYGDSQSVVYTIVVDQRGGEKIFTRVQEAIDSIPSPNNAWIKIQINPGVYTEKVTIPQEKPCIVLEGRSPRITVITYDDHEATDTSSTFTSFPDNIVVQGITFKNSFNRKALMAAQALREKKEIDDYRDEMIIKQAVAARVFGDKVAFFESGFIGLQDTLWDVQGRHYFHNCYIEGAIDFIFGSGQSIYDDCLINATAGELSGQVTSGYITANRRLSGSEAGGFIFEGGQIIGNIQVYLGRAWGPFSRVIFHGTIMGSCVVPLGWDSWDFKGKEYNIMFAEINCSGPGADGDGRVGWRKDVNGDDLRRYFSIPSFIDQDGWIARLPCWD